QTRTLVSPSLGTVAFAAHCAPSGLGNSRSEVYISRTTGAGQTHIGGFDHTMQGGQINFYYGPQVDFYFLDSDDSLMVRVAAGVSGSMSYMGAQRSGETFATFPSA